MSAKIRYLKHGEQGLLLPLAREFYGQDFLPGSLDENHFLRQWDAWLKDRLGIVIVCAVEDEIVAAIGGLFAIGATTGQKELSEMFLFTSEKSRGRGYATELIDHFEAAGRVAQAHRIFLVHLADPIGQQVMSKIYDARGYRPLETHYVLEL